MIVNTLIPAIVILLMGIVGSGLRPHQFAAVVRIPLPLIGGTLGQLLLLPAGALGIIAVLRPPPELAAGLLLVVACPGGALSNYYCHLGRLNVALSVILTAISSILAFATIPLILAMTFPVVSNIPGVEIPILQLTQRLSLVLLLPIGLGMLIRSLFPELIAHHECFLRYIGLTLLGLLLILIIFDQWDATRRLFTDAAVLVIIFTVFAVLAGWGTGLLLRQSPADRLVFSVEYAVRNVGIAAVVAASTLERPEFVTFAALFVVLQFPLAFLLLYFHHSGNS